MKIDGTRPVQLVESIRSPARADGKSEAQDVPADSVELSSTAQWVQTLQAHARDMPNVRSEVVSEAKDAVQSGTLESDEVLEYAVDAILAGY